MAGVKDHHVRHRRRCDVERGRKTGTSGNRLASRGFSKGNEGNPRLNMAPLRHISGKHDRLGSGNRRVRTSSCRAAAHNRGATPRYGRVPDEEVNVSHGDIVDYPSTCYCGDGHFADGGDTPERDRGVPAAAPSRRGAAMSLDRAGRRGWPYESTPRFSYNRPMTPSPASPARRSPRSKGGRWPH